MFYSSYKALIITLLFISFSLILRSSSLLIFRFVFCYFALIVARWPWLYLHTFITFLPL